MKTPVVFLFVLGLALAHGDGTPDKVNHLETKNVHQVIKPSTLETASTRTGDLKFAHMQYQANQMDNQEQRYQHHSQLQSSEPRMQNEASQFHNQKQVPFYNQDQAQVPQFRQQSQAATGSAVHRDMEMPMPSLPQPQHRLTPASLASFRSQSHEQGHDLTAQVYSDTIHPQQDFYQERRSTVDPQDQLVEKRFVESLNKQSPVISGFQSSEIRATSFPHQAYHQRPSFDNRQQPIVFPGVSQTHSTSVVVSGLKNLPVLPALVYSAGRVPSGHAVAYSRPWFQGGAYVKQHWQTPYARYVYSHIL